MVICTSSDEDERRGLSVLHKAHLTRLLQKKSNRSELFMQYCVLICNMEMQLD